MSRLLSALIVSWTVTLSGGMSPEAELINHLMADYSRDARPVNNASHPVPVIFGFALRSIVDFNIPKQVLKCSLWLRTYWQDEHMTWEPTDHNNVTAIHVQTTRLWRPDITLYENVAKRKSEVDDYPASISSDGTVAWLVPVIVDFSCDVDVSNFPFDNQTCRMTWGSWAYHGGELDLHNRTSSIELDDYVSHSEWLVTGSSCERHVSKFNCCPHEYITLVYPLYLQRMSLYYQINLIMPCTFITILAGFVFILPPECGEKVSLSVTTLLASTVYMLMVTEAMPIQSKVIPLIGRYFLSIILLQTLSTMFTIIILKLHHTGPHILPPTWLKIIFLDFLGTILFMRNQIATILHDEKTFSKEKGLKTKLTNSVDVIHVKPVPEVNTEAMTIDRKLQSTLTVSVDRIASHLDKRSIDVSQEERAKRRAMEWMVLALVLDRLLFVAFLSCVVGAHVYLFLKRW